MFRNVSQEKAILSGMIRFLRSLYGLVHRFSVCLTVQCMHAFNVNSVSYCSVRDVMNFTVDYFRQKERYTHLLFTVSEEMQ